MIGRVYDWTIRPFLPRKIGSFGGIPVRSPRLFDATDLREHKPELLDAIRETVEWGDRVGDVGAGNGVCSALSVQQGARAVAYEGASENVARCRETARLSGMPDRIEVRHAIVGEFNDIYGSFDDAERIAPSDLPQFDVMILDCEGSEADILRKCPKPDRVVVETHPEFGVSTADVQQILNDRGYDGERRPVNDGKDVLISSVS